MERKSLFAPRVDLPQFLALFAMTECFEGGGLTVHFAVLFCPKFADSVHPRFCPTIGSRDVQFLATATEILVDRVLFDPKDLVLRILPLDTLTEQFSGLLVHRENS